MVDRPERYYSRTIGITGRSGLIRIGTGEPNDYGSGEDCVLLNQTNSGGWNDASCSTSTYFICEETLREEMNQIFEFVIAMGFNPLPPLTFFLKIGVFTMDVVLGPPGQAKAPVIIFVITWCYSYFYRRSVSYRQRIRIRSTSQSHHGFREPRTR